MTYFVDLFEFDGGNVNFPVCASFNTILICEDKKYVAKCKIICQNRNTVVRLTAKEAKRSAEPHHIVCYIITNQQKCQGLFNFDVENKQETHCFHSGFCGGEKEIRTLVGVLAQTRFPVVRLRPTQPSLHRLIQFNTRLSKCQYFF